VVDEQQRPARPHHHRRRGRHHPRAGRAPGAVAAGLDEDEDLFSPVPRAARRRAVWLGINLATAFLAAWVIGQFEATLEQVVALAVLMPIVASMGGIAGTQTLTLMVRGLALGQVGFGNMRAC
jgi:magnesium transporter